MIFVPYTTNSIVVVVTCVTFRVLEIGHIQQLSRIKVIIQIEGSPSEFVGRLFVSLAEGTAVIHQDCRAPGLVCLLVVQLFLRGWI